MKKNGSLTWAWRPAVSEIKIARLRSRRFNMTPPKVTRNAGSATLDLLRLYY
jgi:hypothetical protein